MKPYPNVRDLERLVGITWGDLAAREPRLGDLLWEARAAGVACHRRPDVDRVFAPIRNTLAELVGFGGKNHRDPVLGSAGAYQVAYWKLYDAVAGLLPGPSAGAEAAPEKQRGEKVTANAPPSKDRRSAAARLRFDRTVGFWLGGILLGAAGCVLGGCLPYQHPVGVTISALWWGVFFGCFGASLGGIFGLWAEGTPAARKEPSSSQSCRSQTT